MALELNLDALAERLETPGAALLVTPNARLARTVRQAFDRRQRGAGRAVWTPARVLAWSQWLQSLWTGLVLDGHEDRILLNPAQEHALWREIAAADAATVGLTPLDSLAELSRGAFGLASAYRGLERIRGGATLDVRTFSRWAEEFQRRCAKGRWLSSSLAEAELAAHLQRGSLALPKSVELCGMGELTPNRQHLLELLQAAGCRLESIRLVAAAAAPPEAATAENEASETRLAAEWLREQMLRKPDGAFAMVVPGLAAEWPSLEPVLREVLAPELNDIAADPFAAPWAAAAGTSLANAPMAAALLGVARWLRGPLPLEQVTELLLSPYLGIGIPLDMRARFDAHVRRRELLLRPELSLGRTLRNARDQQLDGLTDWLTGLKELSETLATQPPRRTYADWMEFLRSIGKRAGWLDEERMGRQLTAGERATADVLDAVLDLTATLDFAGQRVTFSETLSAVSRQTASAPIPANPSAAVEIVDFSAAEGLAGKDAIVFLRSTDKNLPRLPQANPLLDWGVQRTLAMPGTDAAADAGHFERVLRTLLEGTEAGFFTVAEEGRQSSNFSSYPALHFECKHIEIKRKVEYNSAEIRLEEIVDDTPIPPLPSMVVSGGARLIQLQAACGFLAFAEMRLGGQNLETQEPGFDAVESGNILHRALEAFWKSVVTWQNLHDMNDFERREAVEKAVDAGLAKGLRLEDAWDSAYLSLQKQRMQKVLLKWLDFELERTPFTVFANENKQSLRVGPLELEIRVDRMDRLPDDGLVFVDYKTGSNAKPSAWETDRPDQPQLPLYSLLAEPEELRGLTFARIRAGEMQWAGYASDEDVLPKKGSKVVDIPEAVAGWREVLGALASDFSLGKNHVYPKSYETNCKRCSQRLLCRLNVEQLMAVDMENAGSEGEENDG